jgi:hypothetical protein
MGFIVGIYILKKELQRREKLGLFQLKYQKVIYGAKMSWTDLIFPAIIGFLIGWKALGVLQNLPIVGENPGEYFGRTVLFSIVFPSRTGVILR